MTSAVFRFDQCNLSGEHTRNRYGTMDCGDWGRRKFCAEYQSDNDLYWNSRRNLRFTMDDLQWSMCGEHRSGNNQTGCKSVTNSRCRFTPNLMCNQRNLSSKHCDDRCRNLDCSDWIRWKFCQCQQCDHSI